MICKSKVAAAVLAGGAVLGVSLTACGTAQPQPAAAVAQATHTVTAASVPTVTVTQQAPAPKAIAPPAAPAAAQAPDPADVVREFYADLNTGNYSAAWSIGGDNVAGTDYYSWAAGYAGTVSVTGTAVDAGGGVVDVEFAADQADGSMRAYSGTYTVSGGVIVSADVTQTS
jgi:hypothetical protein